MANGEAALSGEVTLELGPQGTGADATAIRQIRDALLDRQIVNETSVRGSFESRLKALQFGQAALGQEIDRQATGADLMALTALEN